MWLIILNCLKSFMKCKLKVSEPEDGIPRKGQVLVIVAIFVFFYIIKSAQIRDFIV